MSTVTLLLLSSVDPESVELLLSSVLEEVEVEVEESSDEVLLSSVLEEVEVEEPSFEVVSSFELLVEEVDDGVDVEGC
jgi:ribosomal protein L12E/L44/L45/RPP1/RPP2